MQKGIDDRGPYYQVRYYFTDWTQSDAVANQLRGYTSRVGTTTIRVAPHQHPLSPNLICMDCTIEGCGSPVLNSLGQPVYSSGFFAICTYRAGTWGPLAVNDPGNQNQIDPTAPVLWCSQEIDFEEESYVLEGSSYTWLGSGLKADIPVKVPVGIVTLSITYPDLPYLPILAIRSLYNCVNTVAVLGVGIGKLWFKGGRTQREMNTDGTLSNKCQLVFKERTVEWNKYLKKDGSWDYLIDGSSNKILAQADLSPLLVI